LVRVKYNFHAEPALSPSLEKILVETFPLLGGTFLTQLVRMKIELPDPKEAIN
jgi:hypothetical protein